ncbi:DUF4041 domain-containing protein [Marinobacterium sedimentorum]|uniref:DUF4041 domain-containing protein n=1 Tax=Marinobacterium sedimentorum TaxID=2927804 RepID=UPI0020C651C7|nr:DUF4041 domain-containing protein [Marinobacterium sedimentorum]MCP8689978.1 DUF4041 domain-containing protein [Marinobacterium sedimentorum]
MESVSIIVTLVVIAGFLFFRWRKSVRAAAALRDENESLRQKYAPILDVEAEVEKQRDEYNTLIAKFKALKPNFEKKHEQLSWDYNEQLNIYRRLKREMDRLYGNVEAMSFGIYEPYFEFETPEKFKETIKEVREQQKALIKDERAASCDTDWQVGGSKTEGRKMIKRQTKLMLRAFNGECDAAISKVKWNNVLGMEERIRKSLDAINKTGESMNVSITPQYLNLKLKELRLNHELAEKQYQIKEEQRQIREEMREEEKARRELEKAQQDAQKEEQRYQQVLEKARLELQEAHGAEAEKYAEQIQQLEQQLADAHEKSQRAISRAQETKSGHVYVISNEGSFGEDVYKIGMTRRLEPLDRVRELGDASVPFLFDVHAMIFSHNAPELERELHNHFDHRRLNLVNNRKEFFHINLDEIEEAVTKKGLNVEFTKIAEAHEYRESVVKRRSLNESQSERAKEEVELADGFPESI